MKLLSTLEKGALADARLDATNADDEAWWTSAKPVIWRRLKTIAIVKATVTAVIVSLAKGVRLLDGTWRWLDWPPIVFLGVVSFGLFAGFFLFQANNQLEADREKLRKARRLHRAILAERDGE